MHGLARVTLFFSVLTIATTSTISMALELNWLSQSIGVQGEVIILRTEVAEPNLFDLSEKTLRFTPTSKGYRSQVLSSLYFEDVGNEITASHQTLRSFPFFGSYWNDVYVHDTGSLTFGANEPASYPEDIRFSSLEELGPTFLTKIPSIRPYYSPRFHGKKYINYLSDRTVITWDVSEGCCDIQDYILQPNNNIFQAVLHHNGVIDFNYQPMQSLDAIVGLYSAQHYDIDDSDVMASSKSTTTTLIEDTEDASDLALPGYLDIQSIEFTSAVPLGTRVNIHLRDLPSLEELSSHSRVAYRIYLDTDAPYTKYIDFDEVNESWRLAFSKQRGITIKGPGVVGSAVLKGNSIQFYVRREASGDLAAEEQMAVFADSIESMSGTEIFDQVPVSTLSLPVQQSLELDLSSAENSFDRLGGYEVFHYSKPIPSQRLSCELLSGLDDNFDFLVFYSQFRSDKLEAGPAVQTVSNSVSGTGRTLASHASRYCSQGRLKGIMNSAIYAGANQATSAGPRGVNDNYAFALTQVGHEIGHHWSGMAKAHIAGQVVELSDGLHWNKTTHLPVVHSWSGGEQASLMGGGYWQDQGDGSFEYQGDGFFSPVSGYSYLDLYLMGFLAVEDVPPFYVLQNVQGSGGYYQDKTYFADRIDVEVEDIISALGTREPSVDNSQKKFSTGFVYLLDEHSPLDTASLQRVQDIQQRFYDFWAYTTGGVATMDSGLASYDKNYRPASDSAEETIQCDCSPISEKIDSIPYWNESAGVVDLSPVSKEGKEYRLIIALSEDDAEIFSETRWEELSPTLQSPVATISNEYLHIPDLLVGEEHYEVSLKFVDAESRQLKLMTAEVTSNDQ